MQFMRTELRDYFREWIDLKNCALKNFSKYVKCKKKVHNHLIKSSLWNIQQIFVLTKRQTAWRHHNEERDCE